MASIAARRLVCSGDELVGAAEGPASGLLPTMIGASEDTIEAGRPADVSTSATDAEIGLFCVAVGGTFTDAEGSGKDVAASVLMESD